METAEQISKFQEFFESTCYEELLENISKGDKFIIVEFTDLAKFNPELAELLLEEPEELIRASEIAIDKLNLEGDIKDFRVRFKELPEVQRIKIRNLRSKHLNKFLQFDGIVRQKSDVRPQVTLARFECPSCGNIITVMQTDTKFKEPSRCGCGRKGKFRLISKELVDAQRLVMEEAPEDLEGGEQPKRLSIFLRADLVSPMTDKKTNPGSKIMVTGILKEIPIIAEGGVQSTRFDLMLETNYVEAVMQDYSQIEISEKEMEEIKAIAESENVMERLVGSVAPSIFGHEPVKEALLLQMVGGVRKKRKDGMVTRGDIHVLLIGDPGSGKSQMLKRMSIVAPKARFVSGKGATGAGLTAAVVKDEFIRGYALEAGALVLTNKGLCCIDELDKMSTEDRSAMHEALEQQTVSISKANIQATLRAETTVLAAANPKFGRFDPYEILAKQIDLPATLINRFDLIFPVRDLPNAARDEQMADFVLKLHQDVLKQEVEISTELMKKYISYARTRVSPKLTSAALNEIKRYYVQMRNKVETEGGIQAIPISPRQLEALIRLSEASARLRLSDKISKQDAKRAIDLIHFCLSQIGVDPETGKIDIDRITTGITASQRSHIAVVREVINELENAIGKTIPMEDIVREAGNRGVEEDKVEEIVEKLKRSGDIFSPKHGLISKI